MSATTDRPGVRLAGRSALVTGAASGIGRASAIALARHGASVAVTDIVDESARAVADEIKAAGGVAFAARLDVSDEADWHAVVATTVERFGGVDILHNNAARTDPSFLARDTAQHIDAAHWRATLEVNLIGTALGCKHVIPRMLERSCGSIINSSSVSGLSGDPGLVAYAASKGGINALTRAIAIIYGKQGVRCNAVAPGVVLTEIVQRLFGPEHLAAFECHHLTPRLGTPEDIANAVVFLASDEAAFITGQVLPVDGGFLSHFPTTSLAGAPSGPGIGATAA